MAVIKQTNTGAKQKIDLNDYTKGGTVATGQRVNTGAAAAGATKIDTNDYTKGGVNQQVQMQSMAGGANSKIGPSGSREMIPKDQETQYYSATGIPEGGKAAGGTGLQGVSKNTSAQLSNYQNGYQESERVRQAQELLAQNEANKPKGYTSKYSEQLDSILDQIQNPQAFKYSFDGDELFKSYQDRYTQLGKQASMDTMGQAAGLTGGYGNSYGAVAGNQAYQQYLMGLYDKGMDLRDRAYEQYRDQAADRKDTWSMLNQADQRDYDRYRDEYGDWLNEREYLTGRADTERNFDYNQYNTERDYWTNMAQLENKDYWTGQEFNENKRQYDQNFAEQQRQFNAEFEEKQRQFNESLDWDKMSEQQKYAAEYAMQLLQMGHMPSDELLQQAGLSAADAKKLKKNTGTAAGGGGGGGGGKGGLTNIETTLGGDELDPEVVAQMMANDRARDQAALENAYANAAAQTAQANARKQEEARLLAEEQERKKREQEALRRRLGQ